jgi:hypothetical protein
VAIRGIGLITLRQFLTLHTGSAIISTSQPPRSTPAHDNLPDRLRAALHITNPRGAVQLQ